MNTPPKPPPPDVAERRRALNPRRSFIVQAPAGSGKTELLVRRYLALLAEVEAPEEILAITFTRAATAEMRSRVSEALRREVAADDAELANLTARARANDARRGWRLADNPRRLRIATIDAFCNELVRRMPWSARFGSPPEIIEDAAAWYAEAAKTTLDHIEQDDEYAADCRELLALVDADWRRAGGLLAGLLGKRDKWMQLLGRAAGRAEMEAMWAAVVAGELARVEGTLTPRQQKELVALGAFAAGNLTRELLTDMHEKCADWTPLLAAAECAEMEAMLKRALAREAAAGEAELTAALTPAQRTELLALGEFASKHLTRRSWRILALRGADSFPPTSYDEVDRWQNIAELVLTGGDTVRKMVNVTHGFPTDEPQMKARMKALLDELAAAPEMAALGDVRLLPGGGFSDAQWRVTAALRRLLMLAAAELRLLFAWRGAADYIELTQRAAMALGESDDPTDLTLAFDSRLSHLLMDEFQDTSTAHIELLTRLTAGWQADDGRTLFLVGDPMQSIYRFREAEVANFLEAQENGLGEVALESVKLKANFRSAPALVAWFNEALQQVLPPKDNPVGGAVEYSEAVAHEEGEGEVRVHATISTERAAAEAAELEAMVDVIAQALGEAAASGDTKPPTIAVLGRTRSHLRELADLLRQRKIRFAAVDMERLAERPAIRDLTALTRALLQPTDRIAWLSVLRAPWCGLTLADLTALAGGGGDARAVVELWRDETLLARLSADGRARLARLAETLDAALARRGRIDLRRNVEAAWLALGGPAAVGARDLDDCRRYLDQLTELATGGEDLTAERLREATETLWAQADAHAQVQLLTIHRAKGLEFDIVLLPRLHRRSRGEEQALLRWRKLPDALLIAPLPPSTERDDRFYRYLAHLDSNHARFEAGRLLYVACTRARRVLHLFGCGLVGDDGEVGVPYAGSLLAMLWPAVAGEYEAAAKRGVAATTAATAGQAKPPALRRLPADWSPPELSGGVGMVVATRVVEGMEFSWAQEAARVRGVVIHQILQQVDVLGWAEWRRREVGEEERRRWRRALLENGLTEAEMAGVLRQVEEAVSNTRLDERAAWIFSAEHRDVHAEWPLSGVVDGEIVHVVIDRCFVDGDGVRWVVDFKSSRHEGADVDAFLDSEQRRYRSQMARYAKILRGLDGAAVRVGLYFPALRGWREWGVD